MKKKFILTIILALILAGAFVYIQFFEQDKIIDEKKEKELFTSEVEELGKMFSIGFIPRIQESFLLVNSNNNWELQEPFSYKIDRIELDSIIEKLEKLELDNLVEEDVEDKSKYGLDNPEMEIHVVYANEKRDISIGSLSFDNNKRYLEKDSNGKIYFISSALVDSLLINYETVLDKSFINFNAVELEKIEMKKNGNDFVFNLNNGKWFQNKDTEINQEAIIGFVNRISNIDANSIYPGGVQAASFENPVALLSFETDSKIDQIKAIIEEGDENNYLLKIEEQKKEDSQEENNEGKTYRDFIFKISKAKFDTLFLTEEELKLEDQKDLEDIEDQEE